MTQSPIEDACIQIKPTPKLVQFLLKNVQVDSDTPKGIVELKNCKKSSRNSCVLSLVDVKWLKAFLVKYRETRREEIYLHELIRGAKVVLPQPKVIPRNPELDARVKKLYAQQQNKVYQRMTKHVDNFRSKAPEDTLAYQIKEMNRQMLAVAVFVITVIAAFIFGFLGLELLLGSMDYGFRLLLGIISGLIVALAEIYVLAKKLNEDYSDETQAKSSYSKVHQD